MSLESTLEGVLFYRAEPIALAELSRISSATEEEVRHALTALASQLSDRGLRLVENDGMFELMTASELSGTIETMRKEELRRDIGKAGAETLSIILYNGSATRAEIDFVRGVNSTFILRNLLIRGLVERVPNPSDQRSFVYKPTLELFAHLGIARKEDLPNYGEITSAIEQYRTDQAASTEASAASEDVPVHESI